MNSDNKTIIITGGTSGIGKALVEYFARLHYHVVFTGRNAESAKKIIDRLQGCNVAFLPCDFRSFASISEATERILESHPLINCLINNAGTWEMEFKESADGIETNFAVNHLGPMLFTLRLLPGIDPAAGRIINTSSGAHRRNILDLDDPEWRHKPYDGIATYSQSKLCNILFTHRLSRELAHTHILVNTVHPGYVQTNLFTNMGERNWHGVPDANDGARSAIFAATDTRLVNRSNMYLYHEQEDPNLSSKAQDPVLADRLWELSHDYLKHYLIQS